jgi:hypothetical protein
LHVEAFILEKALLEGDTPGAVVGVAVALQTDGAGHGGFLLFGLID